MYKCQQQDPLKSRGRKASESQGDVVRGSPPVLSGLRDAGRAPMSQGARERQEHCHPHLLEKSTLVNSVLLALRNLAQTSDTTWAKRWTQ